MVSLCWLRRDLRLADQAALYHALRNGQPVVPVFVFDTNILNDLENKADRRVQFIHHALTQLQQQLQQLGSTLHCFHGTPQQAFAHFTRQYKVAAVYANHDYEPYARRRDEAVQRQLAEAGVAFHTYKDQVIFEKNEVVKDNGEPYTVFTPYSRKWKLKLDDFYLRPYPTEKYFASFYRQPPVPVPALEALGFAPVSGNPREASQPDAAGVTSANSFMSPSAQTSHGAGAPVKAPGFAPVSGNPRGASQPDAAGVTSATGSTSPSTETAHRAHVPAVEHDWLHPHYPETALLQHYAQTRDYPAMAGTSRLSVHLRFGTISIRRLAKLALLHSEVYLNELIWREFYQMILWHFPHVEGRSFRPGYDAIQWRNHPAEFEKWCTGQTGYPVVDAGMRELNATGYMHNRVRMITAGFLTKHLLIDWRWGEAYFAQHLLDYDLAANNGGWQWAAGSGCDAAPYFRVFNPALQTQKFDKDGQYVRKWVPELDELTYPLPVVVHEEARKRALAVYGAALKNKA